MLRILVIIAVALAVVIGLMQLAKHNNAVQAPDAVSEATPAEEAPSDTSGVVDAAGAAIETPADPSATADAPADGPSADAPTESSTDPATETAPQAAHGATGAQNTAPVERAPVKRVERRPAAAKPAVDPYELQRALPTPTPASAPAQQPVEAAPAVEAPATAPAEPAAAEPATPAPAEPQPTTGTTPGA